MSARTIRWCAAQPHPQEGHLPLEPGENEVLVDPFTANGQTVYSGSGSEYRAIGHVRICRLCACVYMEEME